MAVAAVTTVEGVLVVAIVAVVNIFAIVTILAIVAVMAVVAAVVIAAVVTRHRGRCGRPDCRACCSHDGYGSCHDCCSRHRCRGRRTGSLRPVYKAVVAVVAVGAIVAVRRSCPLYILVVIIVVILAMAVVAVVELYLSTGESWPRLGLVTSLIPYPLPGLPIDYFYPTTLVHFFPHFSNISWK